MCVCVCVCECVSVRTEDHVTLKTGVMMLTMQL